MLYIFWSLARLDVSNYVQPSQMEFPYIRSTLFRVCTDLNVTIESVKSTEYNNIIRFISLKCTGMNEKNHDNMHRPNFSKLNIY